ncbi:hypothetical protein [Planctomicrobium sp. SH527]|uniref:hypothetical protein n=1 Tax=Planctomicrobium sp. SH527 TaxID=3448123 RepID=UPI003F5BDFC8
MFTCTVCVILLIVAWPYGYLLGKAAPMCRQSQPINQLEIVVFSNTILLPGTAVACSILSGITAFLATRLEFCRTAIAYNALVSFVLALPVITIASLTCIAIGWMGIHQWTRIEYAFFLVVASSQLAGSIGGAIAIVMNQKGDNSFYKMERRDQSRRFR